jgi:hypothetical protein
MEFDWGNGDQESLTILGGKMDESAEMALALTEEALRIRDRTGKSAKLTANRAQRAYAHEAQGKHRNIVLKARQMGVTTWIAEHPCKSVVKGRRRCIGRGRETAQLAASGFIRRVYASRRVAPALRRTGHPFAVSGSWEPSQKIEFVFSASPKTIRREPREP